MESTSKVSYKSVVCERSVEVASGDVKELQFLDWNDLPFHNHPQFFKRQGQAYTNRSTYDNKQLKREAMCKKELLLDMLNDIGYLTDYVKEYYGSQGIGDDLKLDEVLNAFESSIHVDVHSETDLEMGLTEEDE